jgi:hypothetical protein
MKLKNVKAPRVWEKSHVLHTKTKATWIPPHKKKKRKGEGKNQGNSHKFKKAGLSPRNTHFEPPKYLVSVKEMSGKNSWYFVQG